MNNLNNPMIFSLGECEKYTTIKDKVTFIIASCQAPMNFLMWSVFSLLLRSKVNGVMEHFIITLNGPDNRTGDDELQNKKQSFLEELRSKKWKNKISTTEKDMPVTVMRVWSRIGHAQAIDMAIPWVHTIGYVITHDDIILLNNKWETHIKTSILENENIALASVDPLLACGLFNVPFNDKLKLNLPHLNSVFIGCRKDHTIETGVRWSGYHLNQNFNNGIEYDYLSADFGAWMYQKLKESNKSMQTIPNDFISHFGSMSWTKNEQKIKNSQLIIEKLESEICEIKEYKEIYEKYHT